MLLTRASEYALLSLDKIRKSDKPVRAELLANELNIPKSFLAKILQNMAKQGILESKKGAHGGFVLLQDTDKISIKDVIIAAEGKAPAVFDCASSVKDCTSEKAEICSIWPFLNKLQGKIDTFLAEMTLEEILN